MSIDTETNSVKAKEAKLIGISFSCQESQAFYLPINHKSIDRKKVLDMSFIIQKVQPLLANKAILKIGQNIKYDFTVLENAGFGKINSFDDTMLMSYTLYAGLHNHNLDLLSEKYLNIRKTKFKELVGTGKKEISFSDVDIELAKNYACEDADVTIRLWKILKNLLIKTKLVRVYQNIEKPLVNVIKLMEEQGIKINKSKLSFLAKNFDEQIKVLQKKIFLITKKQFNINSTKQLGEVLFIDLKLPRGKRNKSGGFSTSSDVLESLKNEGHKIATLILQWREITKLKNTYTESLISSISKNTNRIHTTFQMTGAQTGRISSTDPNLQNIPIKTKNGKEIRKAFIPEKGYKLVCFDYSQIELRILAHIANIKPLKNAFLNEIDIHRLTASQVLEIPIENVTAEQRRNAKAINFGIIYGLSAFGLSKQIDVSRSEAKNYIDTYFRQYPGIKSYMDKMISFLSENGYVKTLFGRRININGFQDKNPMLRNYANRQAINAPIQGSAADIIKRAMIKISNSNEKEILENAKLLLQVHDELVFEIKDNKEISTVVDSIKSIMEKAHNPIITLDVPIIVSVGQGDNWEEAH